MLARVIFAILILAGLTSGVSGQDVQYATRGVQPTHAIRFTAQPLRISLTDRGIRSAQTDSVQPTEPRHTPRKRWSHDRRIVRGFIGGHVPHQFSSTADRSDNEGTVIPSRTLYGSDRGPRQAKVASPESDDAHAVEEAPSQRSRLPDHVFEYLLELREAVRRESSEKTTKTSDQSADTSYDFDNTSESNQITNTVGASVEPSTSRTDCSRDTTAGVHDRSGDPTGSGAGSD